MNRLRRDATHPRPAAASRLKQTAFDAAPFVRCATRRSSAIQCAEALLHTEFTRFRPFRALSISNV